MHLIFMIGCAFCKTGTQLIAFRALQGLALSLCMPTSVGIITYNFASGTRRNVAFACFGGGNPVGYATGLLLGGIFVDTVGWRFGYYLSIGLNAIVLCAGFFSLPNDNSGQASFRRLKSNVDWIGLAIISADLALLSYVLSAITSQATLSLKHPVNVALLVLALLLIPSFVLWESYQERNARPAVIPNSLWRRAGFATVCIATFLTWATFNAFAFWATLLMQKIQHTTALQTSLKFLPLVICSVTANIVAGYLVDKVTARTLAVGATALSAIAPALLAVAKPDWSYWTAIFPAMCLIPLSSDLLFSISNLVITNTFPSTDQALAGGVFNTVSQLGSSIGLALTAAIAASVGAKISDESVEMQLLSSLKGYRAAFWTCLAAAVVSCLISSFGLRKAGKVGVKRE